MLPIHEALPELRAALSAGSAAVLVAPPGAGKTTVVPLELLGERWRGDGKIIVLEPRRLAARAAAERMARTLGEPVGQTVGYRVRMQSRVSAATRIEVVTEGVFTRMILADPELAGVACVIFDEFHERSLDADLGLALARDAQGLIRDDLRLLVMSATLDGAAVAGLLGDAPVVESLGRAFPVETKYLGRDERLRLEDRVVRAVERALAEEAGSVLVFLPGQGEILRTAERLAERPRPGVVVAPLFGALDPAQQDRAISPAPAGVRKVVLATSIAETSLTIEGVRVVIDCGLARVPRFDPASGLTRLATVRVSRAAADQRRGRAGRTEPGVCYRLWGEAETRALPAYADPEILDADLSGLALDLARWGAADASGLAFLDPPPAAAFSEARALLKRLEALGSDGVLTAHGRALADMPLPPRLAHMVLKAADTGQAGRAARVAALLTERGLGGRDVDLRHRLEGLDRDRSPRARDARALADRWAGLTGRAGRGEPLSDGLLLAFAYPERIARARGPQGEFQLVGGRGAFVEPTDALARETWLAAAELGGGERRDRILLAAPLEEAEMLAAFADQLETEDRLEESGGGKLRAKRLTRLGRLVVREQVDDNPDPALIAAALADRVRAEGVGVLPWGAPAQALRERIAFLRRFDDSWPDLSDEALAARLDDWLIPLLGGVRALSALKPDPLEGALRALIPWDRQRALDAEAPGRWTAPTGNSFAIDYAAEGGPRVDVRVQEVFGLTVHPAVAGGRAPLTLSLLSPGHRPVQTTKDLPGFWKGSWKDVRADMRGRYPKHVWPEDPAAAAPTARAKPRGT
ncbi:ATP-dependent helicase HrpB [Phenylobacterium hankyongense]|uniref:ATP-dependent helicase HrpB n=1 Tax=Phenylobacterium hankyongense TaxID=1813876 RepID=A0A328B3S5_9CAUL|nr:ATP-dependent helicase HrpB [Phenylobacterium hankyongense]RAK61507.1 ATP-dependent helicase HrpB [Phenylobacterium hankyongense]